MNDHSQTISWLSSLRPSTLSFLELMKGEQVPGFYKYSFTGDLHDENAHWGLGNAVFAVKIYYTLQALNELPAIEKTALVNFIRGFETSEGQYYDPLVKRLSWTRTTLAAIRKLDFKNFSHQAVIRAETRQALSALHILGVSPKTHFQTFPKTTRDIERFLDRLRWDIPWSAGSHFSHLLFFLHHSQLPQKKDLIDFAIHWINKIQRPRDGMWYRGAPSRQQKINGAMKIITGLKAAGITHFAYPEQMISACLSVINDTHACDNFNIIFVLKYALQNCSPRQPNKKVLDFFWDRLNIYRKYYHTDTGGFSFYQNRANTYYYGARITKGRNEADIHGTVLFLWGISIIVKTLELSHLVEFREHTT